MDRVLTAELYRCDLCRHPVDAELRARARRGWQPLIICDRCVRGAADSTREPALIASTAR
jgi:hypothetical protein